MTAKLNKSLGQGRGIQMARKAFYSFHYAADSHRASQVRNIGVVEGNSIVSDNDWETITKGGEGAIKKWISDQMYGKSCCVVLVGAGTADRKWINHEIVKAWDDGMGVVGIRIHGLKNLQQQTSIIGKNPFDFIGFGSSGKKLSSIVKCYDPNGNESKDRYNWIAKYLSDAIEEAINIRKQF